MRYCNSIENMGCDELVRHLTSDPTTIREFDFHSFLGIPKPKRIDWISLLPYLLIGALILIAAFHE